MCPTFTHAVHFVFQRRGGDLVYVNIELLGAAPLKNKMEDSIRALFL
jgi:hypothetical protein